MFRVGVAIAAVGAAAFLAAPAHASEFIADRNVTEVSLKVNQKGEALITYRRENGLIRRVLAWGAINARTPTPELPQVKMRLDYGGGWAKYRLKPTAFRATYWKRFTSRACRPYDGPPLVYLVTACKAPDGSYWALQQWQRLLPLLGFDPWLKRHTDWELHLSHWRGPLPVLELYSHWSYGGAAVGVFARFTYLGVPVYGFAATTRGIPLDGYGRNVYIDTYDSVYGPGWRRESGILTHRPTGTLCHSFVEQTVFSHYPYAGERRPAAPGSKYRATVVGPGVTPDVQAEAPGLGAYDPSVAAELTKTFDRVMAGDLTCDRER
jgi:hypothetical protein